MRSDRRAGVWDPSMKIWSRTLVPTLVLATAVRSCSSETTRLSTPRAVMTASARCRSTATSSRTLVSVYSSVLKEPLPDRLERLVHELEIRHGSRVAEQPAPAFRQHEHLG